MANGKELSFYTVEEACMSGKCEMKRTVDGLGRFQFAVGSGFEDSRNQ